jgi:hypothetical protein
MSLGERLRSAHVVATHRLLRMGVTVASVAVRRVHVYEGVASFRLAFTRELERARERR